MQRLSETSGQKNLAAQAEARFEQRRETRRMGQVIMSGQSNGIRCTIADQSSSGAMLVLEAGRDDGRLDDLPDTFRLFMPYERVEVNCRIAWQNGREMGVQFTSPMRVLPKKQSSIKLPARKSPKSLFRRLLG
ncbi:MAG: hypothetical protein RLZ98_1829 [Pseudomonadota bacterium]